MSWLLAALVVVVAGLVGAAVGRWVAGRRTAPPTTEVAGYRVQAILGSGSTSTVYLGRDSNGKPVAVKVLYRLAGEDARAVRARVDSEVAVLRTVSSAHLPAVLAVADDPAGVVLVTEYVDGATLTAVLARNHRLSGPSAAAVLEGALFGLADLHAAGLVHRDVKPDNIVVTPQGRSRIVDFGLAVAAGPLSDERVHGSPAYMSPEQQAASALDARSDVWSCGAVLFEALHGSRLRASVDEPREDFGALARQVLESDGAAEPLVDLTGRALATDPTGRPADAGEMLSELRERAGRSFGADWRVGAGLGALAAGVGARLLTGLRAGTAGPAAGGTTSGARSGAASGGAAGLGPPLIGAAVAALLAAAVTVPITISAASSTAQVGQNVRPSHATSSVASPTSTASSSPSASASPKPVPMNLLPLLAPNILKGAGGTGVGPITLATLSKPTAAAIFLPAQLTKGGMVTGLERFAGGFYAQTTDVYLLQLSGPAQAQDWLGAASAEAGPKFSTAVPGGSGLVLGAYSWIRFVRGPVVAIVGATGNGARSVAERLAGIQYNLLAAHVPPG